MRRDQDVAWKAIEYCKAFLEVVQYAGIGLVSGEQESIRRYGCLTIGVHKVETSCRLARAPRPARATACVARREVSGHREETNVQRLAIFNDLHVWNGNDRRQDTVLRIIMCDEPRPQDFRGRCAGCNYRSGTTLDLSDSTSVIEVHVRVEDELDVFDPEAECVDVREDTRRGLWKAAVNENVATARRDENGAESVRSYVVRIAVDAERLLWRVPLRAASARWHRRMCMSRVTGLCAQRYEWRYRERKEYSE